MEVRSVPFTHTESGFSTAVCDEKKQEKTLSELSRGETRQQVTQLRNIAEDLSHIMIPLAATTEGYVEDTKLGKIRQLSGQLRTIAQCYEAQENIHVLQQILSEWDGYISVEIEKLTTQLNDSKEVLKDLK